MFQLGVFYDNGEFVEKDVAQALKWFRKAADKGDAESKTIVARLESEIAAKAKAEKAAVQQQTPVPTVAKKTNNVFASSTSNQAIR